MSSTPAHLDALDTDTLRTKAFELARQRHDIHFFWDLAKHVPAAADAASDDGFAAPGASIADFIELFRELRGEHLGDSEPLLRAHFIDYLTEHSG